MIDLCSICYSCRKTIPEVKNMGQRIVLELAQFGEQDGHRSQGRGAKALEGTIGVDDSTILGYVQCLYFEPEPQKRTSKGSINGC